MTTEDIFSTQDIETIKLIDSLEKLQVNGSFPLELPLLFSSAHWHKATSVMDLGTGNGYFLKKIADIFPDKQYVGIDISENFIKLAQENYGTKNLNFNCKNLFKATGHWDFVVARAVVQHLTDFKHFINKIGDLLKEECSALIIDLDDSNLVFFHPPTPLFSKFYKEIGERQREKREVNLKSLDDFISCLNLFPNLYVSMDKTIIIPSTMGDNLNSFRLQFQTALEIFHKVYGSINNYKQISDELRTWCSTPHAYGHISLRAIQITKRC